MALPIAYQLAIALAPTLASIGRDPMARNRKALQGLFDPAFLSKLTTENFRTVTGSPAYTSARNYTIAGSNQFTNSLSRNLEARGLGTTGIASIAVPAAQSALATNLGNIDINAFQTALGLAQNQIAGRSQALQAAPYGTSRFQTGIGKSIEAFLPALRDWLSKRYSNTGGTDPFQSIFADILAKGSY